MEESSLYSSVYESAAFRIKLKSNFVIFEEAKLFIINEMVGKKLRVIYQLLTESSFKCLVHSRYDTDMTVVVWNK